MRSKIIRVFPRRTSLTPTDELAFVGDPPLFRPEADEVNISCLFTWDKIEAFRLGLAWQKYYPVVRVGGPAMSTPLTEFVPGRYVKPGVTFTSYGCVNQCSFCLVPSREGRLTFADPIPPGHIIQDNNFLACPKAHRLKVYKMLASQPKAAQFKGGLETRLVDSEIAAEFQDLRISEVWFAADNMAALARLERAANHLHFLGLGSNKLRCYVLCGYKDDTPEAAEQRLEAVWRCGVMPFAQLYQPPARWIEYSREWRQIARRWMRPAAMRASHKVAL